MKAKEIRKQFLDFFESKQHKIVPSAPLVIKDDPTLMFTNAGMNQFKDYFLGNKTHETSRVTNTQKCLRVSGKHNDLEEVGIDTYHHTMFEMLGNWSFGNYFKEEAIAWAWELLTEIYKLPKDKLYVTVFEGDKEDNLEADTEAVAFWKKHISEDKILYASKADNFWEMGDTGPCGPCSEIHIDLREASDIAKKYGKDLVNQDHPLVVEIWNLVFIQFNRKADKSLEKLPNTHVDTGMGFERLVMAIQRKKSNYETDVFQPIIQNIAKKAGVEYGKDKKIDIAIRVISDHIRAIAFAIADGQLPSNNKVGYVIRRILRRAVRYGYTFLNFKEPFLYELVAILGGQFYDVFLELNAQIEFIKKAIRGEEERFFYTLEIGIKIINNFIQNSSEKVIDGKTAFKLFDTYGFPLDLTSLIARENGISVDENGFNNEMKIQKKTSQQAAQSEKGDWEIVNNGDETEFVGYDHTSSIAEILKYRKITEKKKTLYQLVLNNTPFYAESGGQVGDKGYLHIGNEKISVLDTKKENDLIIHLVNKLPENLKEEVICFVDVKKRVAITNNHSATHLLHAALKNVLGDHVAQKGSLVNENILRFDFSHFAKMTTEELTKTEELVNIKIRQNIHLQEQRNVPIDKAKKMGATALFGEKYDDYVRVIAFDKDYSIELCGGTHVPATGTIGLFKITSESSVAAGVRRIEAITALKAEAYVRKNDEIINEVNEILKHPKDIIKSLENLVNEKNSLIKAIEILQRKEIQNLKNILSNKIKKNNGIAYIIERVSLPNADAMRQLAFDMKNKVDNLVLILAVDIQGKPQIGVMISENLVESKNLHAGQIVKVLAQEIKGGGGGQSFFATAGGKDIHGLENVIKKAKQIII